MAFNHALLDSFERLNILLVDDDAFVIRVLEKTLRLLGFSHLHKAEDGLQALEIMNEVAVDLLIT
ncbi:MAG: hypothetical protein HOI43_08380, partial [Gammaproteobacteria bacterium]|nr:hypothetical protein [Gammaproteobacteria bacterium]